MNRLMHMGGDSLTKKVYYELENLTQQGFDTWVSALCKISDALQLNLHMHPSKFRQECQDIVQSKFIQEWAADIADKINILYWEPTGILDHLSELNRIYILLMINAIAVLYTSWDAALIF